MLDSLPPEVDDSGRKGAADPPLKRGHGMTNRITTFSLALGLAAGLGGVAQAQQGVVQEGPASPIGEIVAADEAGFGGFAVYSGLAITSNYVSNGLTQSDDGPALQGYVEFETSGFYGGLWMSNVDFPGYDDSLELDVYAGYRGETPGGLAYDISYYRYLYNDSGNCCGEFIGVLAGSLSDTIALEGQVTGDPESGDWSIEVTPELSLTDAFAISGTLGYMDSYDGAYGDIGVTYTFNDTAALDFRYADADVAGADGIFYATFSLDTTLFGG